MGHPASLTSRILLTGATGYVGSTLRGPLERHAAVNSLGFTRGGGPDLRDRDAVKALAGPYDAIVHLAGTKDLGVCDRDPRLAWELNVLPVVHLAEAFPEARFIFISSDHVFPGTRGGYREDEAPDPCNAYGRTKAAAEAAGPLFNRNFATVRVSALYDRNAAFPRFLEAELSAGRTVDAFEDAFYSPCWHEDLTALVLALLEAEAPARGIFHACGPRISRYEFARLYAEHRGHGSGLVRPVARGQARVMPDLSLDGEATLARFGLRMTLHGEALDRLA